MWSCGFEFGYDDSPLTTRSAIARISNNWLRWRRELLTSKGAPAEELARLRSQLVAIHEPVEAG